MTHEMSKSLEEQVRELRERNAALVQKLQFWKMTAAQREDEKLDLIKELNELRLKNSYYRSTDNGLVKALDSAIQDFGEQALTRLVDVSSSITQTIEKMKGYIRKKQEIEYMNQDGKETLRNSPKDRSSNKVSRVAPMIGGQSIIKPFICLRPIDALTRALPQAANVSGNSQSRNEEQPPLHPTLQDLYIPLRRIDADVPETDNVTRRSRHTRSLEDSVDNGDESLDGLNESPENISGDEEEGEAEDEGAEYEGEVDYNAMRELEPLLEDTEPEDANWSPQVILTRELPARRSSSENPLEGPSWLLDSNRSYGITPSPARPTENQQQHQSGYTRLEPDSTTESDVPTANTNSQATREPATATPPVAGPSRLSYTHQQETPRSRPSVGESPAVVHTPTRRTRHKHLRISSPRVSLHIVDDVWQRPVLPNDTQSRSSDRQNNKDPTKVYVMLSKMKIAEPTSGERRSSKEKTPQKRARITLEAPSPNGSTRDAGPIVMDISVQRDQSRGSSESDEEAGLSAGRAKRRRQGPNSYKEKPLNRDISVQREQSRGSSESDEEAGLSAGRATRRRQGPNSYKEKPLNRKLRR